MAWGPRIGLEERRMTVMDGGFTCLIQKLSIAEDLACSLPPIAVLFQV